jgi:trans-feruloyl-CoA hydratase/vanillin synthase
MSNSSSAGPVAVSYEGGIAWVTLNRPEKRNAMNPALNARMVEVLDEVEASDEAKVMVLTGAGEAFSAGMDLKEYFRESEAAGRAATLKARRDAYEWQWRRLLTFSKPTIAMVNGWCFGGAFTPMISCDLAIAAEDAVFGLSEVNWGILPAGNVTRAIASKMSQADCLYYVMTGETFDGRKAAEMRLVNEATPRAELRGRVKALAETLMSKNLAAVSAAKNAFKVAKDMDWMTSEEYLITKQEQLWFVDKSEGRKEGIKQFIDEKTYKPGLGSYAQKA